jgi:hypothetical protein
MTTGAESLSPWSSAEHVPIEELARRQGVRPLESLDDLACQIEKARKPVGPCAGRSLVKVGRRRAKRVSFTAGLFTQGLPCTERCSGVH